MRKQQPPSSVLSKLLFAKNTTKKKNYHWGNFCFKLKDILVLFIPLVLRRVNLITQLTFDTGQFFLLINENNADKLPNKFKSSVF